MRRVLITLVLLAVAGGFLAAGGIGFYGYQKFMDPGPLGEERIVMIERGSSVAGIAGKLQREGVISDSRIFRVGVKLAEKATRLRAGEFRFPAAVSMNEAMDILVEGEVVSYSITIPEGLSAVEVLDLIEADPVLEGEVDEVPAEGSLLPETYNFTRGDTRQGLIERMQAAHDAVLSELWEARVEGLPITTPEEAVVLASIVEKETGVAAERPLVAGVFVNRLNRGMPLQSDPTVIYAMTEGKTPLGRQLLRADLKYDSPYNTYVVPGLPPGPIANPGRESLAAVLNPAESEYIYFVADGTGGHAFAKTLAEHNRNVAAWRKVQSSGAQ